MLTGLKISLTHDDWSLYTDKFGEDVHIYVDSANLFVPQGSIYSILTVEALNVNILEDLINTIKSHRRVKKVRVIDLKKNRDSIIGVLSMVSILKDSIREQIAYHEIYYAKEEIYDGKEDWFLVVNYRNSDLISKLKDISYSFDYTKYEIEEIIPYKAALTKREKDFLLEAYRLGYFEWPHTLNINDLARRFGVSKTAVLQTLRRAIKKLVLSYAERNDGTI